MDLNRLSEKACAREEISREEAAAVLSFPEESLLALVEAASRVRRRFFGRRVKLNYLLNAKSGLCAEDCFYCSQSKISRADVDKYPFLKERDILAAAARAVELKAKRFCMVNSGRGPTDNEVQQIAGAVEKVKGNFPKLEVCVCLGLLESSQARDLKSAGVDAYNHNLNTSEERYSGICTTHGYGDRLKTVETAKAAGLSPCSGALFGMGENEKDILDLAFAFRTIGIDSIPVNFLIPIPGTPLEKLNDLTPQKCLKILALFRFVNPASEIRIAGGREVHLRWLQPLGLFIANSIFIGDYLTTKGQKPEQDIAMIRDLGLEIEGETETAGRETAACPSEEFAVRMK